VFVASAVTGLSATTLTPSHASHAKRSFVATHQKDWYVTYTVSQKTGKIVFGITLSSFYQLLTIAYAEHTLAYYKF